MRQICWCPPRTSWSWRLKGTWRREDFRTWKEGGGWKWCLLDMVVWSGRGGKWGLLDMMVQSGRAKRLSLKARAVLGIRVIESMGALPWRLIPAAFCTSYTLMWPSISNKRAWPWRQLEIWPTRQPAEDSYALYDWPAHCPRHCLPQSHALLSSHCAAWAKHASHFHTAHGWGGGPV